MYASLPTTTTTTTTTCMYPRSRLTVKQVFLLSSLNHHLSILRLRIHPRFLEYLATPNGTLSGDTARDVSEWYGLPLQRSKWYDLFDPEDRVQAVRGIWGVMGWMMRANGGTPEAEKPKPRPSADVDAMDMEA